ncbi:Nse1 non-SMC component of SMC5-6 complex-domain-containing protein [Gigaspora rosea]|uniref:Non-structural maintenance of chromosomes element 1 homolog n=1 Tax=Gigaspora rosea TaxID=44941 RepID=A0A397VYE4_9GLOM|nr:Nse1 non-SMC component of SMC5-6 complex-domain-containing protein [Gigaspora rosea]
MIYTNAHRLFVQASMSERFFTEAKAIDMYTKACNANNERAPEEFQEFISTINQKLNLVDMEFRRSHDEDDGNPVWALVNTNGDEIAKLATEYTPAEISYFKRLIELIVTADDDAFSASSIMALKEASKIKTPLSKSAAETLLQRFVDDKWLVQSQSGKYSMSQRTILELQAYLKDEFEDYLIECTLCYDIVTKGQRCDVLECKSRFHHHCARRYFSSQNEKVCPACKITWKSSNIIGDPPKISGGSSRRNRRVIPEEEDDLYQ